jgi:ornithine cyclodeaminase
MAIIGNGAQAQFQALAIRALTSANRLKLCDIAPSASAKCRDNLKGFGFDIADSIETAAEGVGIIATVTSTNRGPRS